MWEREAISYDSTNNVYSPKTPDKNNAAWSQISRLQCWIQRHRFCWIWVSWFLHLISWFTWFLHPSHLRINRETISKNALSLDSVLLTYLTHCQLYLRKIKHHRTERALFHKSTCLDRSSKEIRIIIWGDNFYSNIVDEFEKITNFQCLGT